jgi:uncharacterized protein DUF4242
MYRYIIERDLPGAGSLSAEQLRDVSRTSTSVLRDMGPGIQWIHSFVTADRVYCVYLAENEQLVREHAKRGGFPCTKVSEVLQVIDPVTATTGGAVPI